MTTSNTLILAVTEQEVDILLSGLEILISVANDATTEDLYTQDDEIIINKPMVDLIRSEVDRKIDHLIQLVRIEEQLKYIKRSIIKKPT